MNERGILIRTHACTHDDARTPETFKPSVQTHLPQLVNTDALKRYLEFRGIKVKAVHQGGGAEGSGIKPGVRRFAGLF